MRIIVTRPGPQARQWVQALRSAGHEALALPLIEIGPPSQTDVVVAAWQQLHRKQAVMFVSANAVEHFFTLRPADLALPAGPSPRFWATGPGTLAALRTAGVAPEQIDAPGPDAGQFESEALWAGVQQQVQPGWQVVIVRGDSGAQDAAEPGQGVGRDWLAARLGEQGAQVEFVVGYARRVPQLSVNALALVQLAARDGSVWLFSSSEAISNLCEIATGVRWQQARAVATHPRIAEAARAAGFGVVGQARPSVDAILASIESMA